MADFIRLGLTIKDPCFFALGISMSIFNRWRNSDIEFDRLIDEATWCGWKNAEALAKYHYRDYKRKVELLRRSLKQRYVIILCRNTI